MIDEKICDWLINNADVPIRYRVFRELLKDDKTAKKNETELLENPVVNYWLRNLKPQTPPQHWSMEHGSWDFCLENALLKVVHLGLHGGIPQTADALRYYTDKIETASTGGAYWKNSGFGLGTDNTGFNSILIANFLTHADIVNKAARNYMNGITKIA